jgi:hypothetical protein
LVTSSVNWVGAVGEGSTVVPAVRRAVEGAAARAAPIGRKAAMSATAVKRVNSLRVTV